MEVIVQLAADCAGRLRRGLTPDPEIARLQSVLAGAGAVLRPQHPEVGDTELSRWFIAEVGDRDEGARLAAALAELPSVSAAYAKPAAELPF